MGSPTAEKIAERAFDFGLLNERQLEETWASFGSRSVSTDDFLQFLVRREYLTNYQVERLLKGERSGFFYGHYKILYLVGAGTFARVYRAVDSENGKVVAVKVLRRRFSENPVQSGQFLREGRMGCTLRHPNVVPTYDALSDSRSFFMVMEFVEGRNLREFMKIRKKLEPVEATRLMTDITEGLRYAFERGLTHRDLKMTNVLISSTGQAKLVDFGLAAIDESAHDELADDLPGNARTIDYAALERATGVRKDDTRSDIYFLGCIYYHMLTGVAPLPETRDRVQRLSKTRFLEVVPIKKRDPSMPDSVALVVNKAMMLDPNLRYQSPSAMVADLRIAARRLTEESKGTGEVSAVEVPSEELPAVMVVESDAQMQDIFRKGFRRAGYRVLMTVDPERALSRLHQDEKLASCIILNAQSIGLPAVDAFNRLGDDKRTEFIPTVLLLDERQHKWGKKAKVGENRVVLPMPITMKQLRETLARIVDSNANA
jgi:eukaryotic-like serine/threonine-protein kinase